MEESNYKYIVQNIMNNDFTDLEKEKISEKDLLIISTYLKKRGEESN